MERLTGRIKSGSLSGTAVFVTLLTENEEAYQEAANRLADYEDLGTVYEFARLKARMVPNDGNDGKAD